MSASAIRKELRAYAELAAHDAYIAKLKSPTSSEMSSPFAIRALARFELTKDLAAAHEDVKILREAIIKPRKETPKPAAPVAAPKPAAPAPKPAAPAPKPAAPAPKPAAPAPKPAAPAPKPAEKPATGGAGVAPAPTSSAKSVAIIRGDDRPSDAAPRRFMPMLPRYRSELPTDQKEIDALYKSLQDVYKPYGVSDGYGSGGLQQAGAVEAEHPEVWNAWLYATYMWQPTLSKKIRVPTEEALSGLGLYRFLLALRINDEGGVDALEAAPLKDLAHLITTLYAGHHRGAIKKAIELGELPKIPSKMTRAEIMEFLRSKHGQRFFKMKLSH